MNILVSTESRLLAGVLVLVLTILGILSIRGCSSDEETNDTIRIAGYISLALAAGLVFAFAYSTWTTPLKEHRTLLDKTIQQNPAYQTTNKYRSGTNRRVEDILRRRYPSGYQSGANRQRVEELLRGRYPTRYSNRSSQQDLHRLLGLVR
jgi:hypothetical protein